MLNAYNEFNYRVNNILFYQCIFIIIEVRKVFLDHTIHWQTVTTWKILF